MAEHEDAKPAYDRGYESCIVTFIDILGFRFLINTRPSKEIVEIIEKLRDFTKPPPAHIPTSSDEMGLYSEAFSEAVSDAIVRARTYETQFGDGAFFRELNDLLIAQMQCIYAGVLIRGGLTVGNIHLGPNSVGPIFGPAMVRAFEIESQEAIYPRIVIDDAAYEEFLNNESLRLHDHSIDEEKSYVDKLLRKGEDGTLFIDYLVGARRNVDRPPQYIQFLEQHANLIRHGLRAFSAGSVRKKYLWLAHYHNSVIDNFTMKPFEIKGYSVFYKQFEEEYGVDPTDLIYSLKIKV